MEKGWGRTNQRGNSVAYEGLTNRLLEPAYLFLPLFALVSKLLLSFEILEAEGAEHTLALPLQEEHPA